MAYITMMACCLGMIISGAYHSQCTYLGLIGKSGDKEAMERVVLCTPIEAGIT